MSKPALLKKGLRLFNCCFHKPPPPLVSKPALLKKGLRLLSDNILDGNATSKPALLKKGLRRGWGP